MDLLEKYGKEIPTSSYSVEENSISYPNPNRNCSEENRTFKTARGIGLGSTREDVLRAYNQRWMAGGGKAQEWMKEMYSTDEHIVTEAYEFFSYHYAAIKFIIDQNGKVMVILFD